VRASVNALFGKCGKCARDHDRSFDIVGLWNRNAKFVKYAKVFTGYIYLLIEDMRVRARNLKDMFVKRTTFGRFFVCLFVFFLFFNHSEKSTWQINLHQTSVNYFRNLQTLCLKERSVHLLSITLTLMRADF